MKTAFRIIFAGFLALSSYAVHAEDVLSSLTGEKRIILLFEKSRSSALLDRQVDLLRERRPELAERDLVVLTVAGEQETAVSIGYVSMPRGTNRILRNRFDPKLRGMTIVLVGKDGSEKARWNQLVQPEEIFSLIDTMPAASPDEQQDASTATTN